VASATVSAAMPVTDAKARTMRIAICFIMISPEAWCQRDAGCGLAL
jgi:hypothetical protein